MSTNSTASNATPTVTELRVIPVAGRDSMLLNLSGAHGPFFRSEERRVGKEC